MDLQMPDGTTITGVPDNISKAELEALGKAHAPKAEPSYMNRVTDNLKLGGSAVVRGAAALPALAMDAANWMGDKLPPLRLARQAGEDLLGLKPPAPMAATAAVNKFGMQPRTPDEKMVTSAIEGGAGALFGPGAALAPAKALFGGLASGVGAEVGERVLPSSPTLGRLVGGVGGGLVAGGVAAAATAARPQSERVARTALEGLDPADLAKAKQLMIDAAKANPPTQLDLAQALKAVGVDGFNMTKLRDEVASHSRGVNLQRQLRDQPGQFSVLADDAVSNVPGPVWPKDQVANVVQETATDAIGKLKKERSELVRPLYEQAGPVSPETRTKLLEHVNKILESPGTTDQVKAAAQDLLKKFQGEAPESLVEAARKAYLEAPAGSARMDALAKLNEAIAAGKNAQTTPLHALDVDTAIGQGLLPFKGTPLSPADPKSLGQMKFLSGNLNQTLQDGSKEVREAERIFAEFTKSKINPVKQGPVGQLHGARGYLDDVQSPGARLDAIFNAGSESKVGSQLSPISVLATELKKADKDAFPAAVGSFLRRTIDKSLESTINGGATTAGSEAETVYKHLFATRAKMQGVRDMVAGVARSYDLTPQQTADAVRGMENFAQLTKGLSNRPAPSALGIGKSELGALAGEGKVAAAGRMLSMMPVLHTVKAFVSRTKANTYGEFDRLLTTPEGVDTLQQLGRVSIMSPAAQTILSTFLGTNAALNNE